MDAKSKEKEYRRSTALLDVENQIKVQTFKRAVYVIIDQAEGERKLTLNRTDLVVLQNI